MIEENLKTMAVIVHKNSLTADCYRGSGITLSLKQLLAQSSSSGLCILQERWRCQAGCSLPG